MCAYAFETWTNTRFLLLYVNLIKTKKKKKTPTAADLLGQTRFTIILSPNYLFVRIRSSRRIVFHTRVFYRPEDLELKKKKKITIKKQ